MISMARSLTSDDDRVEHGGTGHVEDDPHRARLHGSEVRQHAGKSTSTVWLDRIRAPERHKGDSPEVIAQPPPIRIPSNAIDEVNVGLAVVQMHLRVGGVPQRVPGLAGGAAIRRDGRWLPFVVHPCSVATFV
jgi:hypothetical protein